MIIEEIEFIVITIKGMRQGCTCRTRRSRSFSGGASLPYSSCFMTIGYYSILRSSSIPLYCFCGHLRIQLFTHFFTAFEAYQYGIMEHYCVLILTGYIIQYTYIQYN